MGAKAARKDEAQAIGWKTAGGNDRMMGLGRISAGDVADQSGSELPQRTIRRLRNRISVPLAMREPSSGSVHLAS